MEITIKINGQAVSVEVSYEVYEYLCESSRKTENLSHQKRRHWDMRGHLIEEYFPRCHVRYIAVNDAIDSNAESDIAPFRYVLGELYSKDVSKKVHSAYMTKAKAGKFTGCLAPFGYRKSQADKNRLEIDEETAWIVRKIYEYAANGHGTNYIRRKLEDEEIPCPAWWNRQKGLRNIITKFERENTNYILNGLFRCCEKRSCKRHRKRRVH